VESRVRLEEIFKGEDGGRTGEGGCSWKGYMEQIHLPLQRCDARVVPLAGLWCDPKKDIVAAAALAANQEKFDIGGE